MAIEIIIERAPDGKTTLWYFRDGLLVRAEDLNITEFCVDPGASGGDEEWARGMKETAESASAITRHYIRSMVADYTKGGNSS
ncbi:hypothetical protein AB0L74_10195 [Streptomyces sp. NPDC052020]|uniref:hypothetical protein n=1 Tax=Streptomyces sp. NPDC052020 TaxID=3155677 RepID=UPI00342983CA